jgi:hypothetical protein
VDPQFVPPSLSKVNAASVPRLRFVNFVLYRSGVKRAMWSYFPAALTRALKRAFYSNSGVWALSREERMRWRGCFESDVRKLEELIQRDLSHWLRADTG